MKLQLIYGKSGSGKSTYMFNQIKEEINLGKKIYIITPEQFSYVTEKRLLENLDKSASINAEVVSFNRLANRVLLECGGIAKTQLSKSAKAMLVYSILDKQKKSLSFLGNSNENVDLTLTIITELKKHNIDLGKLKDTKEYIQDIYLKTKIQDIDNIYSTYESTIKDKYIDEDDSLTILSKQLDESTMFDESIVYIDEFTGFTEQEYIVIAKILQKTDKVTITICANPETINILTGPEDDIFYYNKKTAMRLIEEAKVIGAKVGEPILLKGKPRFKNEELKYLEENICKYSYEKYNSEVESISLFLASNPYSELEYVAENIIKLVKEENFRYKDISVITKDILSMESTAKTIFEKYGIPIFIDKKESLNQNIAIKYILEVIDIFAKNWSNSTVFSYLKSGLYEDISKEEIYRLENYCTKWGIKGSKWYKEDWMYDQEKVNIEELNNLRKRITKPLLEFKKELENKKTAKEITTSIYMFLERNRVREKLNRKIDYLIEQGEIYLAEEYKKSFDIIINLLDEIVLIFSEDKMTFEQYKNILQSGLKHSDLGKIPQVLDQIVIGDVERSRASKTRALFIIGINDGVVPRRPKAEGFLNDNDRELLKMQGIELAKTTTDSLYEEQFNIYKLFATSEEKIFLSYLSSDKDGRSLRPSVLIPKIKKMFPKLIEHSDIITKNRQTLVIKPAFEQLLNNLKRFKDGEDIAPIWFRVYNWFANDDEWKEKLEKSIKGLEYDNNAEALSKENIGKLYGPTLKTSISRLEQYKKCPFSYYLKYGLKLEDKSEFKISSLNTGSFMHEVIDEFFNRAVVSDTIGETDNYNIDKIINDIIKEKLSLSKNYIFTSSPKFIMLTNRIKKVIAKSIKYIVEQIRNSNFNISGHEVEFKERIGETELVGKIDRIDMAENEKGKFITIIDYKSSTKDIDLNEMIAGVQIQLITYIDLVSKKEKAMPSGMLYFNLIDPIIKSNKNLTDEELEDEIRKQFKMKGLILADINIIKMMDKSLENGSSKVIPVSLNKDGTIGKTSNSTITKEEFTILQKTANKIIKDISKEILKGNIEIKPMYSLRTKASACEYCTYKGICGFNNNQNCYSYIGNKPKESILDELRL